MPTIKIRWDKDFVVKEDGYRVYRSTSPIDLEDLPTPLITLPPDTNFYDDDSVDPDVLYYYVVSAFRNTGEEGFGREVFRKTSPKSFGFVAKSTFRNPNPPTGDARNIDRFPFANPFTTATSIGRLSGAATDIIGAAGVSGSNRGFVLTTSFGVDQTQAFPFTSDFTVATVVGKIGARYPGPLASNDNSKGITAISGPEFGYANLNLSIESFPFSTPFASRETIGDAQSPQPALVGASGHQSTTEGFIAGGRVASSEWIDTVQSFPFSSPFTSSTIVGALTNAKSWLTSHSSETHGFSGSQTPPGTYQTIGIIPHDSYAPGISGTDSFPFASPFTTATDIGISSWFRMFGNISSLDEGFIAGEGRRHPPPTTYSVPVATSIVKFPFSTPFAAFDSVGSLSTEHNFSAGLQV